MGAIRQAGEAVRGNQVGGGGAVGCNQASLAEG